MTFQVFHDLCRKICITKIFTLKKTIRDSHWKKIAWFYCVLWQIYNNLYYQTLYKWQMASSFHRFAWLWNWNTFINLSCNINHIDINWDYCWWTTEFMHHKQPVWKCKIAFSDPARVLQKPKIRQIASCHKIQPIRKQESCWILDGFTSAPSCTAFVVLTTAFSMTWYKSVSDHFWVVYHGVSHLPLLFVLVYTFALRLLVRQENTSDSWMG